MNAALERLDRLIGAYGRAYSRSELLSTMVDRLHDLADNSERRGAEPGRAALLDHAAMYRRDAAAIATLNREA